MRGEAQEIGSIARRLRSHIMLDAAVIPVFVRGDATVTIW